MRTAFLLASLLAVTALGTASLPAQASDRPQLSAPQGGPPSGGISTGKAAFSTGYNDRYCKWAYVTLSGGNYYVYAYNTDGTSYYSRSSSASLTQWQQALIDVCRGGALYTVYCPNNSCSGWVSIWTK